MAAGKGLALKLLQWFVRGVQFGCAALVLGIFSYFLAALSNHNLRISNHVRAVEGISGLATLYTLIGLILLCCLAGFPLTSFIAIFLDVCFAAAFIYVAWVNRGGAGSCRGTVDTPFGEGNSNADVDGNDGFTNLPSFHTACRLQTAAFAVSIIAIFFFIFSILVEILLARHRKKEKRFGPSPANNYTSGSGRQGGGFFSSWRRKRGEKNGDLDNQLPEHTTPAQVRNSYNTESTAVAHQDPAGPGKYSVDGGHATNPYGYSQQTTGTVGAGQPGTYQPNPYRYEDGVYDRP